MPRLDIDYSILPITFEIMQGGCCFAATLYRRRDGAHDLYLNSGESELDKLDVACITQLRRLADDRKEVYIDRVDLGRFDPRLVRTSRQTLREWIRKSLSVERGLADHLHELVWFLGDGEGLLGFLFRR